MAREICLFHKFGFCRNGDKCQKSHLTDVCFKRECDYKKCDKRHPRPCKYHLQRGFCKFDSKCSFSHRLPKMYEDQNMKIEALERKIDDQNETIKDLKIKLIEHQKIQVEQLQTQIDDLKLKISEKEVQIKKIDDVTLVSDDEKYVEGEEKLYESTGDEDKDKEIDDLIRCSKNCLKLVDNMESNIKKSRKDECMIKKFRVHSDKLNKEFNMFCKLNNEPVPPHFIYIRDDLEAFLCEANAKNKKEDALQLIRNLREKFFNFLKDPVELSKW